MGCTFSKVKDCNEGHTHAEGCGGPLENIAGKAKPTAVDTAKARAASFQQSVINVSAKATSGAPKAQAAHQEQQRQHLPSETIKQYIANQEGQPHVELTSAQNDQHGTTRRCSKTCPVFRTGSSAGAKDSCTSSIAISAAATLTSSTKQQEAVQSATTAVQVTDTAASTDTQAVPVAFNSAAAPQLSLTNSELQQCQAVRDKLSALISKSNAGDSTQRSSNTHHMQQVQQLIDQLPGAVKDSWLDLVLLMDLQNVSYLKLQCLFGAELLDTLQYCGLISISKQVTNGSNTSSGDVCSVAVDDGLMQFAKSIAGPETQQYRMAAGAGQTSVDGDKMLPDGPYQGCCVGLQARHVSPLRLSCLPPLEHLRIMRLSQVYDLSAHMLIGRGSSLRYLQVTEPYIMTEWEPEAITCHPNLRVLEAPYPDLETHLGSIHHKLPNLQQLILTHYCRSNLPVSVCQLIQLKSFIVVGDPRHLIAHREQCKQRRQQQRQQEQIWGASKASAAAVQQPPANGGCPLLSLPDEIGNMVQLQELRVHNAGFRKLPDSLCELTNLQYLSFNGCNMLRQLPDNIGKLVHLKELSVEGCSSLHVLPASLRSLTGLRILGRPSA